MLKYFPYSVWKLFIIGALLGYITFLEVSGNFFYYLAPKMEIYVKLLLFALYMVTFFQAYLAFKDIRAQRRESEDSSLNLEVLACSCGHSHDEVEGVVHDHHTHSHTHMISTKQRVKEHSHDNYKVFTILGFVLPIFLALFLADTVMSNDLVMKKWVSYSSSNMINATPASSYQDTSIVTPREYQLMQNSEIRVTTENYFQTLNSVGKHFPKFEGKSLVFSGSVFYPVGIPEGSYVVTRFAVQCCVADALPTGVLVFSDTLPPEGSWVEVSGKISTTSFKNNNVLTVEEATHVEVEKPLNPYIYTS